MKIGMGTDADNQRIEGEEIAEYGSWKVFRGKGRWAIRGATYMHFSDEEFESFVGMLTELKESRGSDR